MKMHANARLSLKGRQLLTAPRASGWPVTVPRDVTGCWITPQLHEPSRTAPMSGGSR